MQQDSLVIIVLINGFMGCLMAATTYLLRKNYPKSIQGMTEWVYFPIFAVIASCLYATQGVVHHLLSMALANMLVILTAVAQVVGIYKFYGQAIHYRRIRWLLMVSAIFFLFTSGKPDYYAQRLMFVSGMMVLMLAPEMRLLWRHRHEGIAAMLLLAVLTVFCSVMLIRFFSAAIYSVSGGIYTYSVIQAIYLGAFSFCILLMSVSGVLLASEKFRLEMEHLLRYDELTGAMSRRAILEAAIHEFTRTQRSRAAFSVLLMDVDWFKSINDQWGHQVGDQVLVQLVRNVRSVIRRPADIGRYGGEEFLLILPDTDLAQAGLVAHRISDAIQQSGGLPVITLSIGSAQQDLAADRSIDDLIKRADNALYEAKHSGRNKLVAAR